LKSEIKQQHEYLDTFGDQVAEQRRGFNRSTEGAGLIIPQYNLSKNKK